METVSDRLLDTSKFGRSDVRGGLAQSFTEVNGTSAEVLRLFGVQPMQELVGGGDDAADRGEEVASHFLSKELRKELVNLLASLILATRVLLTYDAILGCCIATYSIWLYWSNELADHGVKMDWNILSMAVVFPISQGIVMGFTRREHALVEFANMLGNVRQLWGAVHHWQLSPPAAIRAQLRASEQDEQLHQLSRSLPPERVTSPKPAASPKASPALTSVADAAETTPPPKPPKPPKPSIGDWCTAAELWAVSRPDGTAELHHLFGQLLAALIAYFDMPRFSRARHAIDLFGGKAEQQRLQAALHTQRLMVDSGVARLQKLVQSMKVHGLPGGEAHRLDQYVSKVQIAFEQLACLKEYRTPQVFRAFSRVYILLLPLMYGPYYCWLATETGGSIGLAMAFACVLQLALAGLLNLMLGLEDPFASKNFNQSGRFDRVKVAELCELARQQMVRVSNEAARGWHEPALMAEVPFSSFVSPL